MRGGGLALHPHDGLQKRLCTPRPSTFPTPAARYRGEAHCTSLLIFLQCTIGVLTPVLAAGFAAPAPGPIVEPGQQEAPPRRPPCGSVAAAAYAAWRGAAAVAAGVARLDAALQACCRATGLAALQLLVAVILLLGSFWTLAKGAALRSLAAAGGSGDVARAKAM